MLKTIRECCRVQAQEGHTTFGTCWHGTWVCGALVTSWDAGNKRASLGLDIVWGDGISCFTSGRESWKVNKRNLIDACFAFQLLRFFTLENKGK